MAYGRGRGGFGRGDWNAPIRPFVPFPDIELPDAKAILSDLDQRKNKEEETIIKETLNWLMKSDYNLDQIDKHDKDEIPEGTNKRPRRGGINSFSQYLVPSMFPKELTRGSNVHQRRRENVQWNKVEKSDVDWDLIEKREKDQDGKKKNEVEKDEDDEENNEEEEVESDESDDYNQGQDFDDDDDDYNARDDGDDEPLLD